MKTSIPQQVALVQMQFPTDSSYICFAKAIARKELSARTVQKYFYLLVEEIEYSKKEVKELLVNLERGTNTPHKQHKTGGKLPQETIKIVKTSKSM
jgi:hypothetical protein